MKLKPADIKLNPANPRLIKDDKFKKLVQSLKDFPEMAEVREVVINKDNMILGGNMRYRAMKEAGWKEIPVRVVDWPEDKQKQFIIKDNIAGGEWDWDILANQWDTEELASWGLDFPDYHSINTDSLDDLEEFAQELIGDEFYHLNLSFKTEEELNDFLKQNNITLGNNYKRVNKTIAMKYPPEQRRDIKNVKFKE